MSSTHTIEIPASVLGLSNESDIGDAIAKLVLPALRDLQKQNCKVVAIRSSDYVPRASVFCVDCKFYRPGIGGNFGIAKCVRNATVAPEHAAEYCNVSRGFDHLCGIAARWFERGEVVP